MPNEINTKNRVWILVALMSTMTLAAMDITIISTAIPQIVSDIGGFQKFTWVFSIYLLAQTITIPIYGKFSDLFGRKKILFFGIIVFLLGSISSGFAWNIESLIAFRALQGIGAGSIMATVNTIAGDIYTVEERARIQGYLSSIWGVSAILGPSLGGAIAEFINWRWIFFINLPIGALSLFLLTYFFKEKVEVKKTKIDFKGALLIMITLSLVLVFLLEIGQQWAIISWQSILLLIAIIILTVITYKVEEKRDYAIMPIWLWKNPTIRNTSLAMIGMGLVMMGPETFLPTFTQSSLGLGIIASGFILASMSIGWPTASALSGRIYLNIGFRKTSMIGASLLIVGFLFFLLLPHPQSIALLVVNQIIIGAGFGLLSTPSLVGAQAMVGWEEKGVVTSSVIFARNLGQSIGASLVGAIFNLSLINQLKKDKIDLGGYKDNILSFLQNPQLAPSTKLSLQKAINISMKNMYIILAIISLAILIVLFKMPNYIHKKKQ
ncbi:MAG TPA: MDR family MFS transporter [Chitinophagaceae bacterium]|nr:MDR family MFS transporter [Chitinophagaceae bacterium]